MNDRIIVIGNGLAGLSAAITAAKAGKNVCMISLASSDRAQSVLAAGGMNAALNTKGEDDSAYQHWSDTMKAGCDIADEAAVKQLTEKAPEIVSWMEDIGVLFSRDQDGKVNLRNFGGQKKKRTVYAKAGIGKQLVCGLSQELRKYKAKGLIEVHEYCRFIEPIIEGNKAYGCIVHDDRKGKYEAFIGSGMIIASGGMSGLFNETTGSVQSDGSVTASLFASGIRLSNCEMIQYHPTTIATGSKRMLISEAARGEGGRLLIMNDGKPWYFMEEWYPEGGNLMPRDIVSKSIYKVCNQLNLGNDGKNEVYLDLTNLTDEKRASLKEIDDLCMKYLNLNIAKEMIPVYPGIHYFMGGIDVNINHRTNVEGLYAAGECCSMYHGANRLGGNSTLGAIYGGKQAAENAACEKPLADDEMKNAQRAAKALMEDIHDYSISEDILTDIHSLMDANMGIVRCGSQLTAGIGKCKELLSKDSTMCDKSKEMVLLALAVISSAEFRKETRGAQVRSDYPERDDSYLGYTSCEYVNGEVIVKLAAKGE